MSVVTVATAVARSELPFARVLAADLRRVHPDWRLTVLLLDGDSCELAGEPFTAIGLEDVESRHLPLLEVVAAGPRELANALRPALLKSLAGRGEGPVVWLDPTVRVLGGLDALVETGRGGLAAVAVHPRVETAAGLEARGPFEGGAIAGDDIELLGWWADLVGEDAARRVSRFDPLAAHLLGAVVAGSDRVRVVRQRALIAGWWTLAAGGLIEGDPPTLDGQPLRAFDFAGFDPSRPHWLSSEDRKGRARVSASDAMARLTSEYVDALAAAGWTGAEVDWAFATLPGGLALDDDLRELYALARREGAGLPSPFTEDGYAAFLRWLGTDAPVGGGVSWYLERVHRRRSDLQRAFPDLPGGDARRLVAWGAEQGVREEPVLAAIHARQAADGPRSPTPLRTDAARVRLIGYLEDGLGLGAAARSYLGALELAGVAVDAVSVPVPIAGADDDERFHRRNRVEWQSDAEDDGPADVEIVCMNPPELLRATRAGLISRERRHRIGVWAWELDSLPDEWSEAFPLVDEVWAYSEYVAAALRANVPVPVNVMPLAVELPELPQERERPPGEPFTFLYVFDIFSSVERKNPLGAIEAFRTAFEAGEDVRLVLKTSNGDNAPEELERIRVAAIDRPDIEVVDAFVSAAERDALIAGCDCYVSLHRAEGFGLTIAEAMAAARPVIATGFSGNLDFMSPATAYLVDWQPATVSPTSTYYPPGARWAEPDVEHAAALMRRVHADPLEAKVRGEVAREHVGRVLSPTAVGDRLRARIEELTGRPRAGGGLRAVLSRRRG